MQVVVGNSIIIFNGSSKRFIYFFRHDLEKLAFKQANLDPQKCNIFIKDQSERESQKSTSISIKIRQWTLYLIFVVVIELHFQEKTANCKRYILLLAVFILNLWQLCTYPIQDVKILFSSVLISEVRNCIKINDLVHQKSVQTCDIGS